MCYQRTPRACHDATRDDRAPMRRQQCRGVHKHGKTCRRSRGNQKWICQSWTDIGQSDGMSLRA